MTKKEEQAYYPRIKQNIIFKTMRKLLYGFRDLTMAIFYYNNYCSGIQIVEIKLNKLPAGHKRVKVTNTCRYMIDLFQATRCYVEFSMNN